MANSTTFKYHKQFAGGWQPGETVTKLELVIQRQAYWSIAQWHSL